MGTISARVVVDKASIRLGDRAKNQWSDSELLGHLNSGQIVIVGLRPDAKSAISTMALVAGTKQSISSPHLRVLNVVRNMGTGGSTPGRAIRHVEHAQLDLENPNWHADTASAIVRQWTYDDRLPHTWWCSPPQPASGMGQVDIVTSRMPTACTLNSIDGGSVDSAIDIDDIFEPSLVEYVVWKAFSKDSEYTMQGGKAWIAMEAFFQGLGLNLESDKRFRPDKSAPPKHDAAPPGNSGAMGA